MTRAVCIVNSRAGGGRAEACWSSLARALADAGVVAEARLTTRPGDGTALASAALAEGVDLVVAVGGDGTVHEVANGFFGPDGAPLRPSARLGVYPAGTGSDLARSLAVPRDPREAAARLVSGEARAIDMVRLTYRAADGAEATRWSINVASVGMAADVLGRLASVPGFVPTDARYAVGALLGLFDLRPFALSWRLDGVAQPATRAVIVAVGNGRCFGGGMCIVPDARLDDGRLDVCVVAERPLWELLPVLARVFTGSHGTVQAVRLAAGREVSLDCDAPLEVDGEIVGRGPVTAVVVPGALRVVA